MSRRRWRAPRARSHRPRGLGSRRAASCSGCSREEIDVMPFSEYLGNERVVTALRGALRTECVPHAMLFCGPRGVGKYTLALMFAQAANCERLTDDFCVECDTCRKIGRLANPAPLIEQGLAQRGENPDVAAVERMPLLLQTHPDVWAIVPDPVRLRNPVARPMIRMGQLRAVQRAAYFKPIGRRRVFIITAPKPCARTSPTSS